MHWPCYFWHERCTGLAPGLSFFSAVELHGTYRERPDCLLRSVVTHSAVQTQTQFLCIITPTMPVRWKGEHPSSFLQFHDLTSSNDLTLPCQFDTICNNSIFQIRKIVLILLCTRHSLLYLFYSIMLLSTYLLSYLMSSCSCVDVLGDVGVSQPCSVMQG